MPGASHFRALAVHRGLSLVELLVSMLLGILLSGAMVGSYLGSKRNHYFDAQTARMQENARYAMRLLSRELGMVGFYGGALSMSAVPPVAVGGDCADSNWALDAVQPLDLVNDYVGDSDPVSVGAVTYTCLRGVDIMPATDIVAIKRSAANASLRRGVPVAGFTPSTGELWYLKLEDAHPPQWEKLPPKDLLAQAGTDSLLSYWEAVSRIFFVRRYSDSPGDEIPVLCVETLAGNAMVARCLVEGVENMQLELGIDTDADGVPNLYRAAPTAAELPMAVTIRLHLLMRSIDRIVGHTDTRTYQLGKKSVPPKGDAYLRRVFSTTVGLRNRVEPIG